MGIATPKEIATYWIDEVGPKGWYIATDALDDDIRNRFQKTWEAALSGDLHSWCNCADDVLGFLILTDQFPRNMFRGDERSFVTDPLARTAAKQAIDRRWDMQIAAPQRQFFYMPLMHSENLVDQDRCVRLFASRMSEDDSGNLLHARAHREIVREFGRFPFRNAALRRMTLPAEAAFIEDGGYGKVVKALSD